MFRAASAVIASMLILSACDGGASTSLTTASASGSGTSNTPVGGSSGTPTTQALSISGQPPGSATVGAGYSFRPTTNAASASSLVFSIQNGPSWASFDPGSGTISGTPPSTAVGSYPGIVVSVSDGTTTASLPAFTIQVSAAAAAPGAGTGSVTLAWDPPASNTDGTPLNSLTGYRIYYGTSASTLSQSVDVNSGSATTFTVQGLASGTWYFAIQAVSVEGTASELSALTSATIT